MHFHKIDFIRHHAVPGASPFQERPCLPRQEEAQVRRNGHSVADAPKIAAARKAYAYSGIPIHFAQLLDKNRPRRQRNGNSFFHGLKNLPDMKDWPEIPEKYFAIESILQGW
jgi:hypothetical protein